MKAEELYELRIGASVTQKALATHLGIDSSHRGTIQGPFIWCLCKRTQSAYDWHFSCGIANYAEFDKIFMAWYCSPYGKEDS